MSWRLKNPFKGRKAKPTDEELLELVKPHGGSPDIIQLGKHGIVTRCSCGEVRMVTLKEFESNQNIQLLKVESKVLMDREYVEEIRKILKVGAVQRYEREILHQRYESKRIVRDAMKEVE